MALWSAPAVWRLPFGLPALSTLVVVGLLGNFCTTGLGAVPQSLEGCRALFPHSLVGLAGVGLEACAVVEDGVGAVTLHIGEVWDAGRRASVRRV